MTFTQDRNKTGHQSDLALKQYTDKTGPRSDSELETGQRQDRTPLRSVLEEGDADKAGPVWAVF